MSSFANGNPQTLKRVAGEAAFQRADELGWINLGDVIAHRCEGELQRRTVIRARRCGLIPGREDVLGAQLAWKIDLQEHWPDTIAFQLLGTRGTDWEQIGILGQSISFAAPTQGRSYLLPAIGVGAVTVTAGTLKTEGVDYTLDAEGGMIHVVIGGTIDGSLPMVVGYSAAPARMHRLTPLNELQISGTLRITEWDDPAAPVAIISFPCILSMEKWGEESVTQYTQFSLRALPTGPIDYRIRLVRGAPNVGSEHWLDAELTLDDELILN